uniref:Delta glutathione S-transferase n=1 Tax=Locusta migratoria TaxID=7004 RepID=V9Q2Q3_LOCMI|nr:delta glutathione S-transferase [Locusta migratoria]
MPSIILYGNELSPPSRAAKMIAEKLGVDVDFKRTYPIKGECKKPEYLKINPMHTIPTIIDGPFTLSDSHAIVAYLVDRFGKNDSLYPKDIQKRSKVNERLCFDISLFTKVLKFVVGPLLRTHEPTEELRNDCIDGLETVERFLSASKFIAGDDLTVADYCYYCTITFVDIPQKGVIDLKKYKNIQRWMDLIHKTCPLFTKYDQIAEKAFQIYLEDGPY